MLHFGALLRGVPPLSTEMRNTVHALKSYTHQHCLDTTLGSVARKSNLKITKNVRFCLVKSLLFSEFPTNVVLVPDFSRQKVGENSIFDQNKKSLQCDKHNGRKKVATWSPTTFLIYINRYFWQYCLWS